jgi:hypothetical protein
MIFPQMIAEMIANELVDCFDIIEIVETRIQHFKMIPF